MRKALVIIPTYNEKETLTAAIESVLKREGFDVLVVDDGSPDGTASLVKDLMSKNDRIALLERSGKLGLGTAYIAGFRWGLARGYDYFIEMDGDGSHDAAALPSFIDAIGNGHELVIGSRYLNGAISVVGWDFKRLMLSKLGNYYAAWILGIRLTDLTSGFRGYSRRALESIDLDSIHSSGYGFQIEIAYRVAAAGCPVGEVPIIFYERESGISKMSKQIVGEAVILPWRLRLGRLYDGRRGTVAQDWQYHVRTVAGVLVFAAGLAGGTRLGWWLSTEGDIIEIIHRAKMGLPGWAWLAMKVGLSAFSGVFFLACCVALAIAVFAGGGRK